MVGYDTAIAPENEPGPGVPTDDERNQMSLWNRKRQITKDPDQAFGKSLSMEI